MRLLIVLLIIASLALATPAPTKKPTALPTRSPSRSPTGSPAVVFATATNQAIDVAGLSLIVISLAAFMLDLAGMMVCKPRYMTWLKVPLRGVAVAAFLTAFGLIIYEVAVFPWILSNPPAGQVYPAIALAAFSLLIITMPVMALSMWMWWPYM